MRTLSKYSPWQSEMAVTASLLKLDLLSDKQVVEYTHCLLDNEYYDDEMLSIIDDDPIYPNSQSNKKILLKKALINLRFPEVSDDQARWLCSYYLIYNYAEQPEDYSIFDISEIYIYEDFYGFLDEGSHLQAVEEFKELIYRLDDACDSLIIGNICKGYNDSVTLLAMKKEFFRLCQQWIQDNHPKIESIFEALYA